MYNILHTLKMKIYIRDLAKRSLEFKIATTSTGKKVEDVSEQQ